ncbi:Rft protein-domain-containing protein [Dimargaris cristalligena]|uniref:Man(5)GlcNAc(2)-PP-dolichol translocation protein RFT1 n=1 Tax=Dimargaris cristalligena TaxID=215637 RepID=A0A4P9ZQ29_9FUNG|nr:Rft protein-domain-containing protein [Dimargaris cristalligena]|eukprot:RKP34470.1 Rft protein-domain-containing protein [Dimargaris cristalligena]
MATPGTETPTPNAQRLLKRSLTGASYLVVLQLFSRLLTFILNQALLRFTDPRTLGVVSIQLELLLSTILFLSREGVRGTLLRGIGNRQVALNLSFVPVLAGLGLTLVVCGYYTGWADPALHRLPGFTTAISLYGLAACLELVTEPLLMLSQVHLMYRFRVGLEGLAAVARCLVTCAVTINGYYRTKPGDNNPYGITAFAVAQLVYSLRAIALSDLSAADLAQLPSLDQIMPRPIETDPAQPLVNRYLSPPVRTLALTLTKQSLLKHFLTEGDKLAIAWLCDSTMQGVYAFVGNYGSLIARILFQPLEETSRALFSRLLGPQSASPLDEAAETQVSRPTEVSQERALALETAIDYLEGLLRFQALLGLLFMGFATNYTGMLIDLLVGPRWSHTSAPLALAVYCLYIPMMAYNGLTEGFIQSVGSKAELEALSQAMVGFSAAFLGTAWLLIDVADLGTVGLIVANMVNMGLRIIYATRFIDSYWRDPHHKVGVRVNWASLWPNQATLALFALSWTITFYSNRVNGWSTWSAKIVHGSVGAACVVATAATVYVFDPKTKLTILRLLVKRKKD